MPSKVGEKDIPLGGNVTVPEAKQPVDVQADRASSIVTAKAAYQLVLDAIAKALAQLPENDGSLEFSAVHNAKGQLNYWKQDIQHQLDTAGD